MLSIFQDPRFEQHQTGRHPEQPARIRAIRARLTGERVAQLGRPGAPRAATLDEAARIHTREYLARLEQTAKFGGGRLDADTIMSPASYEVALLAAGTALAAVESVLSGDARRALSLIRPPGHHALPGDAMGFCLLNNVAIAAAHARAAFGLERVLIVDWDVHHGNGTQDVFYNDGATAFFSVHRFPFYPGTGAREETGAGLGLGAIFNLPLPYGTTRSEFKNAFSTMLEQAVARTRPELILLSAGFDAHHADPVGDLGLESEDYADLTRIMCDAADQACGGKLVSVLEGGYHLEMLAECVEIHAVELSRGLSHG